MDDQIKYYPLTHMQKGIWYNEKLHPDTSIGNVAGSVKINGQVDFCILEKAINIVLRKNESIHLRITDIADEPMQYVSNCIDEKLDIFDFTSKGIDDFNKWCEELTKKPFHIIDSKLFYFALFKLNELEGGFYFKLHHSVSDAWTMSIIINHVIEYYYKLTNNIEIGSEMMPSYTEFLLDEENYINSNKFLKDKEFWNVKFENVPEVTSFRTANAGFNTTESKRKTYSVPAEQASQIRQSCLESKLSIFSYFLSVLAIYISRVTFKNDMVIGVPVLNRSNVREKSMLGMFVCTIPIRINVDEQMDFLTLAQSLVKEWMLVLRHYKYPYDCMVKDVREKHKSIENLYDIVLSYQNAKLNKTEYMCDYNATWHFNGHQTNSLSIHINERENDGNLIFDYDYLQTVYSDKEIEYLHKHLLVIAQEAVLKQSGEITHMEVMEKEEKDRILFDFNKTNFEYPKDKTLNQLFEEQAANTPDNAAAVFEEISLTYRELNERSNQLARILRRKGVVQNSIVGLLMHRSIDMLISIIGVLKAGGAYLPIDPEYPEERVRLMLEDSNSKVVLTDQLLAGKLGTDINIVVVDGQTYLDECCTNLESINRPEDLAYVIYTSGSTGIPKGVMIEHRSVVNFIAGISRLMDFTAGGAIVSITTVSFDVFAFEILPSLVNGMKVVIANEEQQKHPHALNRLILKHEIDKLYATPSRIQMLTDDIECKEGLKRLREIVIGGEVFPQKLLHKLKELTSARIFNAYGPTEATIGVTLKELTDTDVINIGKPSANTQLYILDKNLKPVPIGIEGELFIAGDGLARGYLNSPELTREKFVPNPFTPGQRMYKTGDLARWYPGGEIEFLGRVDYQVKIRGYRIELGEIENQLLRFSGIKKSVVIDREDSSGKKYICAYFAADSEFSVYNLRAFLSKQLPGYMIPSYFVEMDDIPLTLNGKIDRSKLPEPGLKAGSVNSYTPPADETEKKLVELWSEVLNQPNIGIDDNFFELGGDSLNLTFVISRVHKEFDVEVPFAEVYKLPTIKDLSRYIAHAQKSKYMSIQPVEKKEYYPMSSAQKRLFIVMQQDNAGIAYNTPGAISIEGELDVGRLENALREIIRRHEAFRTTFDIINGEPVQVISDHIDFDINFIEANENQVPDVVRSFIRPFDLGKAPLLRIGLLKLDASRYLLLFDMHHIISDGVSVDILLHELDMLYTGKVLPELRIQYKDFSSWQIELLKSDYLKNQEEYWLKSFSGELPVLNIPTDYPRPSIQSYEGGIQYFTSGKGLARRIKKLSADTGSTVYMILLAAFNILLSKYSGQKDIVVGTPVAGRKHNDLESIIGLFVNTLAMRNYPADDKPFSEFLREVRENSIKAYENQDYQFEELVAKLKIRRDISRNPLFDVMFVLQNMDVTKVKMGDLKIAPFKLENEISKFDLLLEAVERNSEFCFSLEYCSRLFKEESMQRMIEHFKNILRAISQNPRILLSEINMLSEEEQDWLLKGLNDTKSEYPGDKTIHSLFEEQVKRTPDAIAAVFGDKKITYGELNKKANQLARLLRKEGVIPDSIIGIMMERSLDMIVSIIGILKSGGSFLPIDPDYPKERISYMLEDSKATVLLTSAGLSGRAGFGGKIIDISDSAIQIQNSSNPETINKPEDLIYVIYTSGSTGKPKGVMLEHRNIVNLISYQYSKTNIDFRCRVLQFTTSSFDVCYQEIFSTLLAGGELHIIGSQMKTNVLEFLDFIDKNQINVIFMPPAYLKLIITDPGLIKKLPKTLKHIIVAGEQLIVTDLFAEYLKQNKVYLHNHYGPSETHVVTAFTVNPCGEIPKLPSIGKPISNTSIYITDKNNSLLPTGIWGELNISGDSVGRGYLYRPELTAEKFVDDPFEPGKRMYKTGDLARWMNDGNLEFLGRMDNQVKIRGFRIELGEVESHLVNHGSVKEAVVLPRENMNGSKYLCAYIVTDRELSTAELRNFLLNRVPDYMVPSCFIKLQKLPLTPNGKVDRRALPEPDVDMVTDVYYETPGNDIEKELAKIWSEILNLDKIGINDNFFELGGDSLAVIQAQVKTFMLNWHLTTQDFYKYQNIKELAREVYKNLKGDKANIGIEGFDETRAAYEEILARDLEAAASSECELNNAEFNNILLTGSTGFLGIHVLNEILTVTKAKVYCIARGSFEQTAEERLMKLLEFYFPDKYNEQTRNRIFVVNADITQYGLGLSDETYSKLASEIDAVVHTAALVKHYGHYEEFEKINVEGTKNIIGFSIKSGSKLFHISTIGVYGACRLEDGNGNKPVRFSENYLYTGKSHTDNVYIKSKFESEKLIMENISKGLDAAILRVGNLTGRYCDGHFQVNINENAFYNRLKSIIELGAVPENLLDQYIEFTPVDCCSTAIVKIMGCKSSAKRIFHVFNHNKIKLKDMLNIFRSLKINVNAMDKVNFREYIDKMSRRKEGGDILQGLIQDFNNNNDLDYDYLAAVDSGITQEYLRQMGFNWPDMDTSYFIRLISYMRETGFLPHGSNT